MTLTIDEADMSEVKGETELSPEELEAQEQADFKAAYSGEEVEEAPAEAPEEQEQPESDPSPQDQEPEEQKLTAEDIDRIRRDALEEGRMKAAADAEQKYTKRIRDLSGELGGYKQKLKDLETAQAAAKQAGDDAPTNSDIKEAINKGGKYLDQMREDFPEIAGAIDEVRQEIEDLKQAQQAKPEPEPIPQPQAAAEEATADVPDETEVLKGQLALTRAHPDWEQVISDPGYPEWLQQQPPHVQQASQSWDPQDAIGVISLYKSAQQAMTSSRDATADSRRSSQRLQAAVAPTSGNSGPGRSYKTEHDEFLEGFKSA